MATWTAFYINTPDLDKVTEKIMALTNISVVTKGDYPADLYNSYLNDDNALPNYLVIGKTQNDWTTIRYNSFNRLTEWGQKISAELNCKVIVTLAQSISDAYYFALYDQGRKIREVEVCYSEEFEVVDFGDHFDFENEQPGKRQEFDGEVSYIFDFSSIEDYCKHFRLNIQTDYDKVTWTMLKGERV